MDQQFMSSPEHSSQQQQERFYNDDPREQNAQPNFQESAPGEGNYTEGYQDYEEGYQGYASAYMQGEKLRPAPPPALQGWKIILIILIVALVVTGSGALGSLISTIFGLLGGSFGLVVVVCIVFAALSTRSVPLPTKTFSVAEHAQLVIHNDAGNVRILRSESNQVEVRGTRYVSKLFGEGSEVPLFATQEGDKINVDVRHWSLPRFFNIGYVNLDIYVPASSDVQMHSNAGTIDIAGVSGRINASTNAGTVMVVSSQMQDGSRLYTSAGTITVRRTTFNGTTEHRTNAGTISIDESAFRGTTTFVTDAGTIHYDGTLVPGSDTTFKTSAGTIDVNLPASSSFELNARTSMGSIHNDFSSDQVGREPRARLKLESQMGTISVRRKGGRV